VAPSFPDEVRTRLEENRAGVLERIARAARTAGRQPSQVELLAVTKSVGPELAAELLPLGSRDLGESRVDELERKAAWFAQRSLPARWHFVGHLQRNKARRVLRIASAIHSVDSERLWATLARLAGEEQRFPGIYLQVKLAPDETKGGLAPDSVAGLVARARAGPLPLLGLMTMAPLGAEPGLPSQAARAVFTGLAALARELDGRAFAGGEPRLSMGMSSDLEEAVRAGSHVVRVGSALFEGLEPDSVPARALREGGA
jgi:hypothetical protein